MTNAASAKVKATVRVEMVAGGRLIRVRDRRSNAKLAVIHLARGLHRKGKRERRGQVFFCRRGIRQCFQQELLARDNTQQRLPGDGCPSIQADIHQAREEEDLKQCFGQEARPPALSEDEYMQDSTEPSSVSLTLLQESSPAQVGNALVRKLQDNECVDVVAFLRVTDEPGKSMSIRAAVCKDIFHCHLAVHFYKQLGESDRLLVEFEHCWGDELVFRRLFSMGLRFLRQMTGISSVEGAAPLEALQSLPPSRSIQEVVALLDSAGMVDSLEVQAEAARALTQAAAEQSQLDLFRGGDDQLVEWLLKAVKPLLVSDCLDVAWPVARFLGMLRGASKLATKSKLLDGILCVLEEGKSLATSLLLKTGKWEAVHGN
jgi:hypothetical protein